MQKTFSLYAKVKLVAILLVVSIVQKPYLGLTSGYKYDDSISSNFESDINYSQAVSIGLLSKTDLEMEYDEADLSSLLSVNFALLNHSEDEKTTPKLAFKNETGFVEINIKKKDILEEPVDTKQSLVLSGSYQIEKPITPIPTSITTSVDEKVKTTNENLPEEINLLIEKYASEYGTDPSVMAKIAKCESGFNPAAVSPSGQYHGLYQFVSGTWISNRKAMGLDPSLDLRRNAEEAIKTAAFKMAKDGYGAWPHCGKV